jgi:hypothetical protein
METISFGFVHLKAPSVRGAQIVEFRGEEARWAPEFKGDPRIGMCGNRAGTRLASQAVAPGEEETREGRRRGGQARPLNKEEGR